MGYTALLFGRVVPLIYPANPYANADANAFGGAKKKKLSAEASDRGPAK